MLLHQLAPDILEALENLHSDFEEERLFKKWCLDFVRTETHFASRHNPKGHLTASAWVLNDALDQALLIHHRGLDKWFQPGGHIEAEDGSLFAAAQRELQEECGIAEAVPLRPSIFDLDIHLIPAKGEMPEHLHLDLRFAFRVPPEAVENPDYAEIRDMRWFPIAELLQRPLQQSVRRMVLKTAGIA